MLMYFGYPQAHEDDAQRAVRRGLALVEAMRHGTLVSFAGAGESLTVQVGIATGIMIMSAGSALASPSALGVGHVSSQAVRLGTLARPGTVVITEAKAQLVSGSFGGWRS